MKIHRPSRTVLSALIILLGFRAGLAAQEEAQRLIISPCDHTTIVTVSEAWPGARDFNYALVGAADPPPDPSAYDAVITVPLRRVVVLASSALGHLISLEGADRVVAVDRGSSVFDAGIHSAIDSGAVSAVGSGAELNVERVVALNPDLVVVSAFGPDDPAVDRLRAAGVPVLIYADWRESTPLGRSEWILLFGALLDRNRRAEAIFAERAGEYRRLQGLVARSVDEHHRPTVMANAPWRGSWPVPAADSYMAQLFRDAGGDYLWADYKGTGSVFLDLESVIARAAEAEVWLNLNAGWRSLGDILAADPRLAVFAPMEERRIYHFNRRVRPWGANAFWESGATRPDLVLADLVRILHPHLAPDHRLVYYRRVER